MILEGTYYNSTTGQDETRCIRCNSSGYLIGAPTLAFTYDVGALPANGSINTDVVDLGEGSIYTLLIARKSGIASSQESMSINSSIDGVRWLVTASANFNPNLAWHSPSGSNNQFVVQGRPIGRFVRINFKNGSTNQTNLVLELAALAGV